MKINNMPSITYRYIVARYIDGEYWFYESYDNSKDAYIASYEFENGVVIDTETEL